jgi:hypothetical protein
MILTKEAKTYRLQDLETTTKQDILHTQGRTGGGAEGETAPAPLATGRYHFFSVKPIYPRHKYAKNDALSTSLV